MKAIVIPDSFKGSMTSVEAANAIEKGIRKAVGDIEIVKLPVADGGEGTVEVFESLGLGKTVEKEVIGPLGKKVKAKYIIINSDTAVIEMAEASGLNLVPEGMRNPMKTTTFGTGELIKDALSRGVKKILLGIGGSATNDGGTALAQALGISYRDKYGREIYSSCEGLKNLCLIDTSGMDERLKKAEILIACDVNNRLCGKEGASFVYGPQKGADEKTAGEMDKLLYKLAGIICEKSGIDVRTIDGTGAAGGIAVPLIAFAGAKIVSGIKTMLDYIGFEKHTEGADIIFTGEGRIDAQTRYGKVISGIIEAVKSKNIPVIAFCGMLGDGYETIIEAGVKSCFCILPGVVELEDAMKNAKKYLEDCAKRAAYILF